MKRRKLTLDASVLIEYIVLRSPHRARVVELFSKALAGEIELYVSAVSLAEALYVASRIYEVAGVGNANEKALEFVK